MEEDNHKSFVIFGRDISAIPCFRNSFLYGILSGFGAGLTSFLFTSRTRASTHFGFASFTLITLGYWMRCRYDYSKQKFDMLRVQEAIKQKALYEGTQRDIDLNQDATIKEQLVDA